MHEVCVYQRPLHDSPQREDLDDCQLRSRPDGYSAGRANSLVYSQQKVGSYSLRGLSEFLDDGRSLR